MQALQRSHDFTVVEAGERLRDGIRVHSREGDIAVVAHADGLADEEVSSPHRAVDPSGAPRFKPIPWRLAAADDSERGLNETELKWYVRRCGSACSLVAAPVFKTGRPVGRAGGGWVRFPHASAIRARKCS